MNDYLFEPLSNEELGSVLIAMDNIFERSHRMRHDRHYKAQDYCDPALWAALSERAQAVVDSLVRRWALSDVISLEPAYYDRATGIMEYYPFGQPQA